MARPNVNIALSNGGLNVVPPSAFGNSGVLVASPVAPVAGYSVPFTVKTAAEAAAAFVQSGNEGVVDAFNKFFDEAPDGTIVVVMAMARTTTLTTLASATNAEKVLNAADIKLITLIKFPDTGVYTPTITTGFDAEVFTAITAMQTLANTWFGKKKPFDFFVQGYAATTIAAFKDYSTGTAQNGHLVAIDIDASTAAGTMLVAGRAARVQPQENIGKIKTGSLNIADTAVIKIGSVLLSAISDTDLDTLYDKRIISIEKNAVEAGYVLNDDLSTVVGTSDFNCLRNNRVINEATRVAFDVYYRQLKDDVDVTAGGRISTVAEKALEAAVESAIDDQLRGQMSKKTDGTADVSCLVNPDATAYAALYAANGVTAPNFNLSASGQLYLFIQVRPKGCLKYLNVYLGFTA